MPRARKRTQREGLVWVSFSSLGFGLGHQCRVNRFAIDPQPSYRFSSLFSFIHAAFPIGSKHSSVEDLSQGAFPESLGMLFTKAFELLQRLDQSLVCRSTLYYHLGLSFDGHEFGATSPPKPLEVGFRISVKIRQ